MRLLAPVLILVFGVQACKLDVPVEPAPPPTLVPPPPPQTRVQLQSDPGDYIGGGQNYSYTKADAIIGATASGAHLALHVDGDQSWFADFVLPSGNSLLQPGTYTGLTRYPFNAAGTGGLDWSGEGRGCNTLTGSMTIDTAQYSGTSLTLLAMRFEQHCEGAVPALHGTIHWSISDLTKPLGPGAIIDGLWKPNFGGTPPTGNYVYLNSDPGDYIGAGQVLTYNSPPTAMIPETGTGRVSFNIAGGDWHGDFQAMNTLTKLSVGLYGGLRRYPFHNPAKGGLSWYGQGRGCNTLTGWFVVDAVTYTGDALTSIDLRFEQHCEGMSPALHGAIHWSY